MPVEPTTSLLVSQSVRAVLERLRGGVEEKAPPVQQVDDELTLSTPDRRVSAGVTFDEARAVPTLFVEREGGWGHAKAEELAASTTKNANVVVRGSAQSLSPKKAVRVSRRDPVRVGASVSNYRGHAGTLGCLVTQTTTGKPGFISAAHVMSMLNRAKPGGSSNGDPVIRPGNPDGPNSAAHRIGFLRDFTYLGHYDDDETGAVISPNREDVALVLLDKDVEADESNLVPDPATPSSLKRISSALSLAKSIRDYKNERVFKLGRTTKLTSGRFIGIETDSCPIMLPDRRVYMYTDLLIIEREGKTPFSADGDSGALVYTEDFKAMGLVVAGNDQYSWATPIDRCLQVIDAELLT